jgi:hypothetical protein
MNELIQYPVPQWIAIFFLMAIPIPFIMISLLIKKAGINLEKPFNTLHVVFFFIMYIGYIAFCSNQGWFNIVSLPPRVLLLTTFPYAVFLFLFVAKTKVFKDILENTTLQSLVKLHIFRLIGVFFLLIALHDALPKPFAFIAGLGDIITAITSIFVAKAIENKSPSAKKITYAWNIFGTIDIMFTAICAIVLTKLSMDNGTMGVDTLARFPFCLIPAFAPPTILFLHWCIFKKMKSFSN